MNKYFVIGDIHGCYDKLIKLLEFWNPKEEKLIFLGDLIDRGDRSLDVLLHVKKLVEDYGAIVIKGNHEELFLNWLESPATQSVVYLNQGGYETVSSFMEGTNIGKHTPAFLTNYINDYFQEEISFLKTLPLYFYDELYIFVHAGVDLYKADWKNTRDLDFNWIRNPFIYGKNETNHTIVFGHTPTRLIHKDESDDIWVSPCGTKIGIDGAAVFGGKLHALRINGKEFEGLSIS
ncbi:metallophosphoesterase [Bacillus thuringiensis]|uniref:metallophosphoesterase n=1 Tax=Bacillus thuringiensis TaxID=1428 RepID=UPI0021D68A72|nr:metallophosphoesterase [Bacillus thuringiensis]MCU7667118.1 metallophosphoesterase [Bacillus thuringiensis]